MQAKIWQLQKTVAALQAQLSSAPQSTTPKVTAFNAVAELIKDNLSTETLVETQSPQKREGGGFWGVRASNGPDSATALARGHCLGV